MYDVDCIIEYLDNLGCPKEIIEQLLEWNEQPLVDEEKLRRWKEWAESKEVNSII